MSVKLANKSIGSIGFGLMGLTWRAKPQPIEVSIAVMKKALERGANFWNGGTFYGTPEYNSIHLLHAYFTKYPEDASKVVINIKGGHNTQTHTVDGSPETMRREIDAMLKQLDGKCFIDVFESARVDPKVPIEETVGAIAEYVKAGKIGGIGLSECGSESIKKASKVHKIASVEVEFSMFSPDLLDNGVAETCASLNIPIVAYSPLSRGLLTGEVRSHSDLADDDARKGFPRFAPENFEKNLDLVREAEKVAKQKGCKSSNVAIAWVKAHNGRPGMPVFVPIPGTTTEKRLDENLTEVSLTDGEFKALNAAVKNCEVKGSRYPGYHAYLEWL